MAKKQDEYCHLFATRLGDSFGNSVTLDPQQSLKESVSYVSDWEYFSVEASREKNRYYFRHETKKPPLKERGLFRCIKTVKATDPEKLLAMTSNKNRHGLRA